MKTFFAIALILVSCSNTQGQVADSSGLKKVVILDTGVNMDKRLTPFLCKKPVDVTGYGIKPTHSHGTHIASIIAEKVNTKTHCIFSIKVFDSKQTDKESVEAVSKGLELANTLKNVDIVNLSLNGPSSDYKEKKLIAKLLSKGVRVNVSAGNDSSDLDIYCNSYPACYAFQSPLFRVVGNPKSSMANHGKVVTDNEDGYKVKTWAGTMTGTSQATAILTAKMLK